MAAIILLCIAVICLAGSGTRTPQSWASLVLSVLALLSTVLHWPKF